MKRASLYPLRAANSADYAAPCAITADPVILAPLKGALHVLLVRRGQEPQRGKWSLPGGFVSDKESPEITAQRKLTEKTGVGNIYLEQLHTYAEPKRDPRGWIPSVAYLALINATVLRTDVEAGWFPVSDLPDMAFDHVRIIADGVERLRGKLWYSNIIVGLLPDRFTMAQARQLYEAISGHRYEPSNFRRELIGSGLVRSTGHEQRGGQGRPAALYEFADRQLTWNPRRSHPPATIGKRMSATA